MAPLDLRDVSKRVSHFCVRLHQSRGRMHRAETIATLHGGELMTALNQRGSNLEMLGQAQGGREAQGLVAMLGGQDYGIS